MLCTSAQGERMSLSVRAPACASAARVSAEMLSTSTWIFLILCEFFLPRSLPPDARLRFGAGLSVELIFCQTRAH